MLPPGQGRPGGQAHCTRTGGWTHVCMCVCACVCVLPPPIGWAGWGPWALGHRPHPPLGLLMPISQLSGGVGPALPCGGSGSAGGDRSSARGHVAGAPGPSLDGGPHTWHRPRAPELSVNACVGSWVLACGDRPGAPEAPGRDPGCLEPEAEWAVEGQPWTSGLSQEWGDLVVYVRCLPSWSLAPRSVGLDSPVCLESWL